jgi:hypothetical protein
LIEPYKLQVERVMLATVMIAEFFVAWMSFEAEEAEIKFVDSWKPVT